MPVVITDYTTPYELLLEAKDGIGPRGTLVGYDALDCAGYNTTHALVSIPKLTKAMEDYYNNPKMLEEHGKNGRIYAEKFLNWDKIVQEWKEFIFKNV